MAFGRSATLGVQERWGESVWLLLCRSTLRGIRWSARALASDDDQERLERAELLARLGGGAGDGQGGPARHELAIDWAKLGELDRSRLAQRLGARRWG